ncbi:MAG: ribosome small subunit-dependent GTPase A [Firmicutes bacterium]|nr:ribosome small subunit-dependent GTPase A [Bacillota bacterium]
MQGRIMKGIAGFYFVKSGETIYRCKARGIFKKQEIKPAVGDLVEFEIIEGNDDNLITEILPRRNSFIRPFVANVDCFVVVTAALRPAPVQELVDKLLIMAEHAGTEAVLCINKCDLAADLSKGSGRKATDNLERFRAIYEPVYPVVLLSRDDPSGYGRILELIRGRTAALAGASGVGKSTILNHLLEDDRMETGSISEKSQRGRHTTRHAELFQLDEDGTAIFDTPGFTSFALNGIEAEELAHLYPEIERELGSCRYDNCRHVAEPGCGVKEAVEQGRISQARYDSYLALIKELDEAKKY